MARKPLPQESPAKRVSDFSREKAPGDPLPVYVLRGTDPYLLDLGRQTVRRHVIGDADPGMAMMEVLGGEARVADVLDALRTPTLVSPRRLVVVRDADEFLDEHARELLLKYLQEPSKSGSLCLEVTSWNSSYLLSKRVAEIGVVVACEPHETGKIPAWLQGQATERTGKSLTFGAAQMLLEHLGTDFASLLHAVDMLGLYAGPATTIDTPDVDALIARGHHERVWDLCDAVAGRNLARSLELLEAFWSEGMVAPQFIGLLRATFRQLLRVRGFLHRASLDEAMMRAGVPYPARDRVRQALRGFSEANLADAYQALVQADLQAKTTPNDRLAMEMLIHRLANPEAAHVGGTGMEVSP
jgi:DNA polymerase-3 subunit delta